MKKSLKVSIIVPVYNGELFLDKCVESLLNQTYKNIEVIFSNDGSKDRSLEMIKGYCQRNNKVKYVTHDNVGQSESRNLAFSSVTGDYVTYLDVDDYLDVDFVEKMLKKNDNYDIIIGGYRRVYDDGKLDFEYSIGDLEWNRYRRVTVWAKLYKVSFLRKNKIVFPSDRLMGEDIVYTMRCLSRTDKVLIIDYIGYNNLINEKSLTHVDKDKIFNDVPKMFRYIDDYIGSNKSYLREKKKIVYYYYLKIFVAYLVEQAEFLDCALLKEYYRTSFGSLKEIFEKYGYRLHCCYQSGEPFKVNVMMNVFVICEKFRMVNLLFWLLNKVYYHE